MFSMISKSGGAFSTLMNFLLIALIAENANAAIQFSIYPPAPKGHTYIVAIECNNGQYNYEGLQQFATSGKGIGIEEKCENNMYHIEVSKLNANLPDKMGSFMTYLGYLYANGQVVARNVKSERDEEVRDEYIAPGTTYKYTFGEATFRGGSRFFKLTDPTGPVEPNVPAFELKIHPTVEKPYRYKLHMQCTNNYRMRHTEVMFKMVAYTFTDGKGDLLADNICGDDNKYEVWLSLVRNNKGRYEEIYKPESFLVNMAEAKVDEQGRKQYTLNFRDGHRQN